VHARLVEHASGRVVFHASVENAHSAELLPRDRMVVAGSTGEEGNRLVLYDLGSSGKAIFVDPLHSGHGVVWDPEQEILWALGGPELRSYRLRDWETDSPALERTGTFELPDPGGHDLRAIPGSKDLVVTANDGVHLFDRDAETFREHPALARAARVKSVDVHPASGRLAFVQAEENWWAYRIRLLEPEGEVHLPDERLYKVRWYDPPPAAEPETAVRP
jgi:sugar lactone lactonase YvrE